MGHCSVAEDEAPSKGGDATPACRECGQPLEFQTFLPHFDDRPAYRIFRCLGCGVFEWIAEQVGDQA